MPYVKSIILPNSTGTGTTKYDIQDSAFDNSPAKSITTADINNWNNKGSVTNVAISNGGGIGVSGSPITSSGTITLTNTGVRSITQDSTDGHKLTFNVNGSNQIITIPDNDTITTFYGTCTTSASVSDKIVTINDEKWKLRVGCIIGVKFSNTNTASNVTLNVNGSGAKAIAANNSYPYTSTNSLYCGLANVVYFYIYDGTYWYFVSRGTDANDNTIPSAYCVTAASTAAKTASCTYYTATANSYLHIVVRYANTYAGAITLNVNSTGAKPIYINGSASSSTNYNLKAGTYLIFYDGTNYYFRTDGKLTANIIGDAGTVNGHTVGVNVPSNAKFTDTTYSSKSAASGGTDVSLVTTGEKYTWNSKTSNTGTVTSVAVKMNGSTKGTITTSGTVDLGTVITSHQDISGKVNKTDITYDGKGTLCFNI